LVESALFSAYASAKSSARSVRTVLEEMVQVTEPEAVATQVSVVLMIIPLSACNVR
jgi:hypothetical protein